MVIEGGLSKAHVARLCGVSAKVVARSVERYAAEGRAGWWTARHGLGTCRGPLKWPP